MLEQIKKTMIISLAVLFLVSLTASAVSADTYDGTKGYESGHTGGGGDVHLQLVHEDNGNGNAGLNNGQGNYGTAGYDNQQYGDQPGEHMGSEYIY